MSYTAIENNLYALESECISNKSENKFSMYVLYAVSRYISTDRAPMDFLKNFVNIPQGEFKGIINECLTGDKTDEAILKKFKKLIKNF